MYAGCEHDCDPVDDVMAYTVTPLQALRNWALLLGALALLYFAFR